MNSTTPMLRQYQEIKARHSNSILFFRLGDFYEMFMEDAQKAAGILDVVLTSRDAGKAGRIPMCGIPYHAADTYIAKLIKAGLKVAICEQVEDPALAKGIVKRDVIRTVTSGTYIEDANYESRVLLCLCVKDKRFGLALIDTASGTIQTNEYAHPDRLIEIISHTHAYEIIFPGQDEEKIKTLLQSPLLQTRQISLSPVDDWLFNTEIAYKALTGHLGTKTLRGFGIEDMPASITASGALLEYLKQMHKQPLRHIHRVSLYADEDFAFISPAACYGLEIEGLLQTIDHTQTAMGKRKLRDWLYRPLKDVKKILSRQKAVSLLRENTGVYNELTVLLKNIPDIEKAVARISCGTSVAKDFLALRQTLAKQPEICKAVETLRGQNPLFSLDDVTGLRELLAQAISPNIPLSHPEGKVINAGYNAELDQLRDIQENGRDWLKKLQAREIKRTGINSLKIGFNNVFGYYIEISKANLAHAPADYIRRQTLTNAERFITPELKDFEEKMLSADEKILNLERALIAEITRSILDKASDLRVFSGQLATLDILSSLAAVSLQPGYIAPKITDDSTLEIKDGRHPVVEKTINEPFIPNDTTLDCEQNHLIILTGPNMAGKSTYIRQTAILVILAQIGSYIPAASAAIGIVDKIFTRIGAHDEITKGQSTFMVEMSETAGILNNLSPRSLVVLDEIGRGTSTFDGLSLAWAISEHLAKQKVRTMFATHFHELTALGEEFPGVKNYNVSVKEWNDEVIFLHKIVPGGTDDSYGIYVAKLAGIPKDVVTRARQILTRLEISGSLQEKIRNKIPKENQMSLFEKKPDPVLSAFKEDLEKIDINNLTPVAALNALQKLKEKLSDHE